jgi:hypothetical protein
MLATSIQFIGIFVIMANTGGGLHILLPHFPGTPYAEHTSAIQFSSTQVASMNWPNVKPCVDNPALQCAPIDIETITFSGAVDPAPLDVIGNMPRLRCCCSSMTDIQAKYKDPQSPDRVAAHILVDNGVAEAIAGANTRIDTRVTMHTAAPAGITVTGSTGKTTFKIVFNPGVQFSILNDMPPTTPSHFLAYYLMGVGSSKCTALPSAGGSCAPSAPGCVLPKTLAKTVAPKTAKVAASPSRTKTRLSIDSVDIDCSNSHWP